MFLTHSHTLMPTNCLMIYQASHEEANDFFIEMKDEFVAKPQNKENLLDKKN